MFVFVEAIRCVQLDAYASGNIKPQRLCLPPLTPINQKKLKTYRPDSQTAIERKLKQADRAFADWSALPLGRPY